MAGIFAAWSGHFGWHMHAGASTYTDFGDTGWCFGASDYYIGNTSTADVRAMGHSKFTSFS